MMPGDQVLVVYEGRVILAQVFHRGFVAYGEGEGFAWMLRDWAGYCRLEDEGLTWSRWKLGQPTDKLNALRTAHALAGQLDIKLAT